jgi:hypothetical protein
MRHRFLQGVVIIAIVGAIASIVWLVRNPGERTVPSDPARGSLTSGVRPPAAVAVAAPTPRAPAHPAAPAAPAAKVPQAGGPPGDMTPPQLSREEVDAMGAAWSAVDMEEVRKAMPDNLYWKLSAPTQDPQVIEEREAERSRWNVEYGKILSGTASEEEIRTYYDNRARLSGDYIEFASYLVDHYEGTLSERDIGLLKLAIRLHRARLEELPRKIEEAFERKRQQDAAREAWLADQAIFGNANPDAAPADEPGGE